MIEIIKSLNSFLVWKAEDVSRLREELRIVGSLIGCLPHLPNQNVHLGLPLQLMDEEVSLLVNQGQAVVMESSGYKAPIELEVNDFKEERKRLFEEQVEACSVDKRVQMSSHMTKILFGKRKKLEEQYAAVGVTKTDEELDAEVKEFLAKDVCTNVLPLKSSFVQIHAGRRESRKMTLVASGPIRSLDTDDCRIFAHFYNRGFYLTRGGKFGGNFLAYPGDPSRFHSFFIVVCLPSGGPLSMLELIRWGRLGSQVKKTVVMCHVDSGQQVKTLSLRWTKFN